MNKKKHWQNITWTPLTRAGVQTPSIINRLTNSSINWCWNFCAP